MIIDYGGVSIFKCLCTFEVSIFDSNKNKIVTLTEEEIYKNWRKEFRDAELEHESNMKDYIENKVVFRISGEPFLELAYKIKESKNKTKLLAK